MHEQWPGRGRAWPERRRPHQVGGPHRGWDRRRPTFLAPVVFSAIQLIGCGLAAKGQPDATPLDSLGRLLLVIGPVALVLRRPRPLLAAAVGLFAAAGYLALNYPGGPFFVAALFALFTAVRRVNRVAVWTVCALAYASYAALALPGPHTFAGRALAHPSVGQCLVVGAWLVVALAIAETAKVRGAQLAEVARAQAEASRARREQSRRQASDERLQIARELHDVLGHHLSLINVRAGVGLHLLDSRPDEARAALEAIKAASSEALRDVRGVLDALAPRSDDTAGPRQPSAPRAPAPGLADLDRLAQDARSAGLAVTVSITGERRPVPATVDRAAYRIVQEALTNVRRHAGPDAIVRVDVTYAGTALNLRISNDGAVVSTMDDSGNGLPGMRERASALGGTLVAQPRPEGGFSVAAALPLLADARQSP